MLQPRFQGALSRPWERGWRRFRNTYLNKIPISVKWVTDGIKNWTSLFLPIRQLSSLTLYLIQVTSFSLRSKVAKVITFSGPEYACLCASVTATPTAEISRTQASTKTAKSTTPGTRLEKLWELFHAKIAKNGVTLSYHHLNASDLNFAVPASRPARCDEPIAPGNCLSFKVRWYFNKNQGECVPFVYSGCGGSSNNFVNKENCESMCKSKGKSMTQ